MSMVNKLRVRLADRRVRFLIAGGWNTAFGYGTGVILYIMLAPRVHVVVIGMLANVVSISMSFVTYKVFVFRTQGRWIIEYLKSYVVYGLSALLGVGVLWLAVSAMHLNIWIAQAFVIASGVVISYAGHAMFTFRRASTNEVAN